MSFVVSINGQFRPYELPDFSHIERQLATNRSNAIKPLLTHEDDDFETTLAAASGEKETNHKRRQLIQQYKKSQTLKQEHHIPTLAKDLMSKPVDCLTETDTLQTVIDHMNKYQYRHFPIVNSERNPIGMVSDRDIIKALHLPKSSLIKEFMATKVLTAYEVTRIQDVAKIMLHEKINCLPIINDKHVIVGIITQTNILDFVIRSFPIDVTR